MSDEMQILDHISKIPRVPHPSDSGFLSLSKISIHREGSLIVDAPANVIAARVAAGMRMLSLYMHPLK